MRNAGGYAKIFYPGNETVVDFDGVNRTAIGEGEFEADTFTCFHCGSVTHVLPRMDPANIGGLCKQCYRLICPRCVGRGCDPLEKRLEQEEARARLRREYQDLSR